MTDGSTTYEAGGSGGGTAKDVASTAQAKGGEVARTAQEEAKNVASEARQQAGDLAQEAKYHATNVIGEAKGQLRQHATSQAERAAGGVRTLSQQVQALVDGRTEEAGPVGDYARQAGDRLRQAADRMESEGVDGLVDDVSSFARRRPGVFLLGAAAAGFAAARVMRGAQASSKGSGPSDDWRSDASLSPARPYDVEPVPAAPLVTPPTPTETIGYAGGATVPVADPFGTPTGGI